MSILLRSDLRRWHDIAVEGRSIVGESGGSADRKAAELRARGLRSAGAWAAGADGERRVAAALSALPETWLVLHDRLLMPGLAESNIDHLLVGPAGVVLIDAKNWAGQIGEWNGSVFQHSWRPDGSRLHRPVDREFAGVLGMATEVARRINHGVTVVICLAGRQAEHFGEPRLVKNVWVVPVGRLVDFLTTRPLAPVEAADRLGVLVRTEFPSTTTDTALLSAMGRDLALRSPRRSIVPIRRVKSPGPAAGPPRKAVNGPVQRRRPRRSGLVRPLSGLLLAMAMLVAVQNGVLTAVMSAAGSAVSESLFSPAEAVGPRVAASAAPGVVQPSRTAAPALLSCRSFDPSGRRQLARVTLTPTAILGGCYWTMPGKAGGAPLRVLWIREDTDKFGLLPTFPQSAKDKAAVVTNGWRNGRWTTHVWVAKGVPVGVGKKAVKAQRHTEVMVAHEALGLTKKQGRALAISIAGSVSSLAVEPRPAS